MLAPNSRSLVVLLGVVLLLPWAAPSALAGDKLLDYQLDLVTDNVDRGEDIHVRRFDKEGEKHGTVNVAPAVQPQVTFYGQSGLSLNLWGSFAASERDDDNKKGFLGLGRDDELHYTLAFDWSNRLGGFTAALIYYVFLDACKGAQAGCNRKTPEPDPVSPDLLIAWAAPFAEAIYPRLSYYANPEPGAWYATLDFSGGGRIFWAATLGTVAAGPKDLTLRLGYALDSLKVSLDGAYRPNPELVGPYDKDGHYVVKGKQETYPATILWLTLSYGGSVAAQ